jgi:lipopolysaccharide transport system ATP-binding protein
MPRTSKNLIEVDRLWAGYRLKTRRGWRSKEVNWALHDVSLTVAPGESLGVIGSNGSGKSTLLQCMAGVVRPVEGSLRTYGKVASLVDLSAGFHRELTGRENTLIVGVMSGMSRAEVRATYDAILEFSGLEEQVMDAPMFTYSMGMQLRLGFSLLIHGNPRILLVDEVLAVGDESFQRKCLNKIEEMVHNGCCVVLVSHDMSLVQAQCKQAAVMDKGSLEFLGPADQAVERYLIRSGAPIDQEHYSPVAPFRPAENREPSRESSA